VANDDAGGATVSPLTVGSLFSGVGGFDMGLEAAGWDVRWQVEIDDQARAVLRTRWPQSELQTDVSHVGRIKDPACGHCGHPSSHHEWTLGSECRRCSCAEFVGSSRERTGLAPVDLIAGGFPCQDLSVAGRRGGLAGERSGLFYEFMRIVDELAPRWVLIENVPGLLSSNDGRDMGAVVGTLGELGYGHTYRTLDLQHFGAPQRRRRVFIVGRAGGFCPPEVLFEPESLPGDSPTRTETRETTSSRSVRRSVLSGRVAGEDGAGGAHGVEGFACTGQGWWTPGRTPLVPVSFHNNLGRYGGKPEVNRTGPLKAVGLKDPSLVPVEPIAFKRAQVGKPYDRTRYEPGQSGTLSGYDPECIAAGAHPPAVAFFDAWSTRGSLSPNQHPVKFDGLPDALDTTSPGAVSVNHAIPRRLTPKECERLMSWPDDWTRWQMHPVEIPGGVWLKRKETADGPRYRMCGNGVGAAVAEWIAERIVEADAALRDSEAA
jgi:DNA (cytosine-5)-methyltransferase 1